LPVCPFAGFAGLLTNQTKKSSTHKNEKIAVNAKWKEEQNENQAV
jgi:hypothetical protein